VGDEPAGTSFFIIVVPMISFHIDHGKSTSAIVALTIAWTPQRGVIFNAGQSDRES